MSTEVVNHGLVSGQAAPPLEVKLPRLRSAWLVEQLRYWIARERMSLGDTLFKMAIWAGVLLCGLPVLACLSAFNCLLFGPPAAALAGVISLPLWLPLTWLPKAVLALCWAGTLLYVGVRYNPYGSGSAGLFAAAMTAFNLLIVVPLIAALTLLLTWPCWLMEGWGLALVLTAVWLILFLCLLAKLNRWFERWLRRRLRRS